LPLERRSQDTRADFSGDVEHDRNTARLADIKRVKTIRCDTDHKQGFNGTFRQNDATTAMAPINDVAIRRELDGIPVELPFATANRTGIIRGLVPIEGTVGEVPGTHQPPGDVGCQGRDASKELALIATEERLQFTQFEGAQG
jgi:hypothetical protein